MKTIHHTRAAMLERKQAFDAVITLRTDLKRTDRRLALLTSLGKQCRPEAVILARDHVANLKDKLALAEAYCRKINPDELQAHDDACAQKETAERKAQETEQAEANAVLEANRRLNDAKGRERAEVKMLRMVGERQLQAEQAEEQDRLNASLKANLARRRELAEQRQAHKHAVSERQQAVCEAVNVLPEAYRQF
jgi:hypothetical protein